MSDKEFFSILSLFFSKHPHGDIVNELVTILRSNGGVPYLVGGVVRDIFLKKITQQTLERNNAASIDIDIEVHNLHEDILKKILESKGIVSYTGKIFGVYRFPSLVEWSLPRREGGGRKPEVIIDYTLPIALSLRRRDLTMNAIAVALPATTGIIIDPFHGREAIKKRILTPPDREKFIEDPLRFYRVMRYNATIPQSSLSEDLLELCTTMSLSPLAPERIEKEWEKTIGEDVATALLFLKNTQRIGTIIPPISLLTEKEWEDIITVLQRYTLLLTALKKRDGTITETQGEIIKKTFLALLCHHYTHRTALIEATVHALWPTYKKQKISSIITMLKVYDEIVREKEGEVVIKKAAYYLAKQHISLKEYSLFYRAMTASIHWEKKIKNVATKPIPPLITGNDPLFRALNLPEKKRKEILEALYLQQLEGNMSMTKGKRITKKEEKELLIAFIKEKFL